MTATIIKYLEKYFRTDIRYFATGSMWLSIAKIIGMTAAFLLSVAFARYISKDAYGNYRFVISAVGMIGFFTLPGMGAAITRSVSRGFHKTYKKGVIAITISSIGIAIVGIIAGVIYILKGNIGLGYSFLVIAILSPLVETSGSWRSYYDGLRKFKEKTLALAAVQFTYLALMLLVLYSLSSLNVAELYIPIILITSYALAKIFSNIYFFIKSLKTLPQDSREEAGAVKYGVHLSLASTLSTIATYLDGVLLFSFLGAPTLAVYSFSIALPEQLKAFFTTVADVGFPKIAMKKDQKELKKTLPGKILKALFLTGSIVLVYIFFAPFIYKIFFPRYNESIIYSQIFSLSLIFFPLGIFGTALKANAEIKKIYIQGVFSSTIQIALIIVLIPIFGLWGAIIARILGRFLNHISSAFLFLFS